MSDLLTYSLSDFLPFSRETYYRLFALHHLAWWPAPLVTVGVGLAILALARRAGRLRSRGIALALAGFWLWVAWAFHHARYASINGFADYFALGFVGQAALLIVWGTLLGRLPFRLDSGVRSRVGLAVCLLALLVQPLIGRLAGRDWQEVEIFGMAPDPTVVVTIGLLMLVPGGMPWPLLALPLLWCAISGATAWTLEAWDGAVIALAGLLVIVLTAGQALARARISIRNARASHTGAPPP